MAKSVGIIYYQEVNSIILDERALEIRIERLQSDLNDLIRECYPTDVKAINYEQKGNFIKPSDEEQISKIALKSSQLEKERSTLERLHIYKNELDKLGRSVLKKVDDTKLKVFIASYLEGKQAIDIADELNYSIDYIYKILHKLNTMIKNK